MKERKQGRQMEIIMFGLKIRRQSMKGYYTSYAYMGYIPSVGKYWQFESETEYINFLMERGEI